MKPTQDKRKLEDLAIYLYNLVRNNVQANLHYVKPWPEATPESKKVFRSEARYITKLVKSL